MINLHLETQLKDLLSLERGWDSYSAPPIDARNTKAATIFLRLYLKPGMPLPWVVPAAEKGAVQLEWHTGGVDLEIYFQFPEAPMVHAAEAGLGRGSDWPLTGNEDLMDQWLGRLTPH